MGGVFGIEMSWGAPHLGHEKVGCLWVGDWRVRWVRQGRANGKHGKKPAGLEGEVTEVGEAGEAEGQGLLRLLQQVGQSEFPQALEEAQAADVLL